MAKDKDVKSLEDVAKELNVPVVDQNEALLDYKVSGVNRGYIDPHRDQEPDIAPEFGNAPHPELFNAKVPAGMGTPSHPSDDPRAQPEEDRDLPEDVEKNAETQSVATEDGGVPSKSDSKDSK